MFFFWICWDRPCDSRQALPFFSLYFRPTIFTYFLSFGLFGSFFIIFADVTFPLQKSVANLCKPLRASKTLGNRQSIWDCPFVLCFSCRDINDPKSRFVIPNFVLPDLAKMLQNLIFIFQIYWFRQLSRIHRNSNKIMWKYRRKITEFSEQSTTFCNRYIRKFHRFIAIQCNTI